MATLLLLAVVVFGVVVAVIAVQKHKKGIGFFERTAGSARGNYRRWRIKCPKASCGRTTTSEMVTCRNCAAVGKTYIKALKTYGPATCYLNCSNCGSSVSLQCTCGTQLGSMLDRAIV